MAQEGPCVALRAAPGARAVGIYPNMPMWHAAGSVGETRRRLVLSESSPPCPTGQLGWFALSLWFWGWVPWSVAVGLGANYKSGQMGKGHGRGALRRMEGRAPGRLLATNTLGLVAPRARRPAVKALLLANRLIVGQMAQIGNWAYSA